MASRKDMQEILGIGRPGAASRQSQQMGLQASSSAAAASELHGKHRNSRISSLTREMQSLRTTDLPPVAIIEPRKTLKSSLYRRGLPAKPWRQTRFTNPARTDGLVLQHWTRLPDKAPPTSTGKEARKDGAAEAAGSDEPPIQTEYSFAHYDDDIWVPQYSEEEYQSHYACPEWSREETDYLLGLVKDFGYRWPLIYDRYEFALPNGETKMRPVEELKHRFYTVWSKSIELNTPGGIGNLSDAHYALYQSLQAYDPAADTRRRAIAAQLLTRSPEEVAEETQILGELQRIVTHYSKMDAELRDLRTRLDAPMASSGYNAYQSSQNLSALFTNLLHAERQRRRNRAQITALDTQVANASGGVGADAAGAGASASATPTTGPSSAVAAGPGASTSTGAGPGRKGPGGRAGGAQATPAAASPTAPPAPLPPQPSKALSAEDERRFCISTHDRLSSGVTFRSDRFIKMRQAKSQVQMHKITAALAELGVPEVIQLPTVPVCEAFGRLIASINKLLDARRGIERFENELKVARSVRDARLKKEAEASGDSTEKDESGSVETLDSKEDDGEEESGSKDEDEDEEMEDLSKNKAHKRTPSVMNGGTPTSSKQKRVKR